MLRRQIFSANIISVNAKALFPFAFSLYGEKVRYRLGIHCLFLRRIVRNNQHEFLQHACFLEYRNSPLDRDSFGRITFHGKESPRIALLRESSLMLNRRDSVTSRKSNAILVRQSARKNFDLFGRFIETTYDCVIKRKSLINLRKTPLMKG